MEIIIASISSLIVVILVIVLLRKPLSTYLSNIAEEKSRTLFKDERERLNEIVDEKIKRGEQSIDNSKNTVKELVDKIREELNKNQQKLEDTEKERIGEFKTLKTVIDEHKLLTSDLKVTADHLKNILSNNQLRGEFGQEIAENLLASIGFVRGEHYDANIKQDTVSTRPDFILHLPDGTKINVDAKFPLQALIKYQKAESQQEKERYLREFGTDVKSKIREVTTRDYINPEENTVDFVILFVPNEMVFSFIYDQLNEIWKDAMDRKVILAGPFSFVAILRMIFQSYKNFTYQKNLFEIIKLIRAFEQEYSKFNEELDKLGTKIKSVDSQYQTVSITRTKKLSGLIEKIKNEESLPESGTASLLE